MKTVYKHMLSFFCCLILVAGMHFSGQAQTFYTNPILHADYSDPDAVRVGEDFYMVASSFNHVPGLPILHSKDLVHWKLIGHALSKLLPIEHFSTVQHGAGVWAPSIRYHQNSFYIYYPDPDFGIYMIKSRSINGPWSDPILVEAGKGLIDPCPFWDDNGKAYLVHAFAGSRAGIKSILVMKNLSPNGTKTIGTGVIVYDGHEKDPTVEGPKMYKRNGFYYVFAPAGGVTQGWQIVLRSRTPFGPYERKMVMEQGTARTNGPHQGAWVNTAAGEDWFLHFQDKDAYGRIVHLQPMKWVDNWPVIGDDADNNGIGNPVDRFRMPGLPTNIAYSLVESDEFNDNKPGLQWQWQANPSHTWAFPFEGKLRMYNVQAQPAQNNLWSLPNLYLQKFPAEKFTAITKLYFQPKLLGDQFGFIVFGADYAGLRLIKNEKNLSLQYFECAGAEKGTKENLIDFDQSVANGWLYIKLSVDTGAVCRFSYGIDGNEFTPVGRPFNAKPGKWVGAKFGFYAQAANKSNDNGWTDIDYIRISKQLP